MKTLKIIAVALVTAASLAALSACKKSAETAQEQTNRGAKYHCPMHPTYTSDRPGDCPICGMRLVPIEAAEAPAGNEGSGVAGHAPVEVSPERRQLIGVRTSTAEKRTLTRVVRASARVAYDPELYAAIAEYREAVKAGERTKESQWPDVRERAESLVRSAALRLRQLGVSAAQIAGMTDENDATNLLLGRPGGNVWIYAQVYERDAALIKAGQALVATTAAAPGRKFTGRVVAVDAILNPETRTLRVRAEVPNPDGVLKPEMYLDAAIEVPLGVRLAVPTEAVMDTGTRQIVFVESEPGVFDPREVTVGREAEGFLEILRGVTAGETVVTSANFLIDSESRLKAALERP